MRPYAVYINEAALSFAPRSGPQRKYLMEFIRLLAVNPNIPGDFSEQDGTGRTIQVKLVGRHAVTYWADHAVAEVKITHIKSADK